MIITVLAFGAAKDIFHGQSVNVELPRGATTADLRALLNREYPHLGRLAAYAIAVNNEYSAAEKVLLEGDEVAVLPPVSGG